MICRNKLFLVSMILLVLCTVSVVSANENITDVISNDDFVDESVDEDITDVISDDEFVDESVDEKKDELKYNAKLSVKDVNEQYNYLNNKIKVVIKDNDGKPIKNAKVKAIWDGKFSDTPYDENGGKYYFDASIRGAGNHKVISTTKTNAVLKVSILDKGGFYVEDGIVNFKINGKTYKAKVYEGAAIKKIKLNKAKNYNYRAIFISKNYKTKSVSSKVYVKKAKKYYTIKAGKYSIKLPYKKYLQLINAKNHHKSGYVSLKTGDFYYYDAPAYKTVKVKKTKWVYKKVLSYESYYYGDGTYDSYSYSLSKYYNAGWQWYGSYDKSFSDGFESYAKLKKKVTYTVSKQVRDGYKSAKSPIYVMVELLPKDALIKKGDYIRAWTAGGGDLGTRLAFSKINFYTYSP